MAYQMPIDRMTFGDRLAYAFRERQIYVRSEGHVRFITLRPWVQIAFVLAMLGLGCWIGFVMLSVAFKDHVIAAKKRQYASMQTVYEDRITNMLSSMDQINGRLLLNQDSVDSRLDTVRQIQGALEIRQRQIATLMSQQFGVAINDLLPENAEYVGPELVGGENGAKMMILLEPRNPDLRVSRGEDRRAELEAAEEDRLIKRLKNRIRMIAASQKASLNMLETRAGEGTDALELLIADLGFEPQKFAPSAGAGVGGPLIAAGGFDTNGSLSADERQMMRIDRQQRALVAYRNALLEMPIRQPLASMGRITSGFGTRRDPFTGGRAMHLGLDIGKPTGTPVMATADGKVKRAGWAGAYGRLVEIAHDNGLSTRYAHMSKIEVKTGNAVKAGQVIGRVGSTGRSSGAHLHYETRANGYAVNPRKYLRAGKHVLK